MADLLKSIIDKFTHLVRDILFYFISGFLVILYILYLASYFEAIFNNATHIILVVICSFVLGHILMVASKIIFENICKCPNCCDNNYSLNEKSIRSYIYLKKEIEIYYNTLSPENSIELFIQYIERYNTLYFFRRNLTMALVFNSIISIIYLFAFISLNCYKSNQPCNDLQNIFSTNCLINKELIVIIALNISIILSALLFYGTIHTKNEMNKRIHIIYDIIKKKEQNDK